MKTVAVLLVALLALAMVGCSEDSTLPVSPTDQSAMAPRSLEKRAARMFTSTASPNLQDPIIDPGSSRILPDGKMIVRGMILRSRFDAVFADEGPGAQADLVTGNGVLEMNFTADPLAGEMFAWGTLTITPDAPEAEGGKWEISWHGKGALTAQGWVTPLKEVGHGTGGALTGMQFFGELVSTVRGFPADWEGVGEGCIVIH